MNWLSFIGGFAVGTIMTLAVLFVGARFAGDAVNNFADEHAEHLGADNSFHAQPTTERSRYDHQ